MPISSMTAVLREPSAELIRRFDTAVSLSYCFFLFLTQNSLTNPLCLNSQNLISTGCFSTAMTLVRLSSKRRRRRTMICWRHQETSFLSSGCVFVLFFVAFCYLLFIKGIWVTAKWTFCENSYTFVWVSKLTWSFHSTNSTSLKKIQDNHVIRGM